MNEFEIWGYLLGEDCNRHLAKILGLIGFIAMSIINCLSTG
jgi:hypothetical protein